MFPTANSGFFNSKKLWTPLEIDVKVFLMANDPANFVSTAGRIDLWLDSSPYGNDQDAPTTATRPNIGTNEVLFNGSTKLQSNFDVTELQGAEELTQFVIFKTNNTSKQQVINNRNSALNTRDLMIDGSTLSSQHRPASPITTTISTGDYYITSLDWALASATNRLWMDTVLTVTSAATAINTLGTNYRISLGAAPNSIVDPMNGAIRCYLAFDSILSTDNRQRVEGYLAHQFLMLANLPPAHPYKVFPPYRE